MGGQTFGKAVRVTGPMEVANRINGIKLFGLIAFRTTVESDRDVGGVELDVRFGTANVILPGAAVSDKQATGRWRVMFNINTHLIQNGEHTLEAKIRWPDGATTPLPAGTYLVENFGDLAAAVRRDLGVFGTPAVFGRIVDSSLFPYGRGQAQARVERELASNVPLSFEPAVTDEAAHRHLLRWGFCVLPKRLPAELVENFWSSVEAAIESGDLPYERGSSDRIHNAHRLPAGRKIWMFPPVLDFLRRHFQDEPCACQTLTFPYGSEQRQHQDTIHLTPYPGGFMCGVWIALQDVVPDSGELVVYPGSHLAPRLRACELGLAKVDKDYSSYVVFDDAIQALIREYGYEPAVYRPKAGEILVWHENLIHGGSPRGDRNLTRHSIVSHYFARGCISYYDSRGEAGSLEALI